MTAVDEQFFAEYVRENQERFYRLAYGYSRNSHEALEVVSEAIVKGFLKLGTLREPEHLKTWFYRILVNESLNSQRRAKRLVLMDALPERVDEGGLSREEAMDLRGALGRLEPKIRTVIILRFYEGMKLEEIAEVTGSRLSTVKSRLYRGLELLRLDLSQEEAENADGK